MGFASGFQSGFSTASSAMKSRRERQLDEQLGQEAARYDVTEGAYGQGLQQNIDELAPFVQQEQGLAREAAQQRARAEYDQSIAALQGRPEYAQNLEQVLRLQEEAGYRAANQGDMPVGPYGQAVQELQRRQGLTAPDYSVGSRATNYGTMQEARQAASPMRTEGLSNVYRQAGEVEKADELEARAFEQQRGLAQEKRAQASFELQQASGKLSLEEQQRNAAAAKRMEDFNAWRSQTPDADFGTMTAKARELGMGVDEQFKIASNLTGIDEQEFKQSQQRIQKLVRNQGLDGLLKAHKDSKDLDPNSHFEVIRGKGGKLSLNRVNTETGDVIQANVFSGSEAETTAYLNKAAVDPATIIDFTMNLEKNKAAIAASNRSNLRTPDINEYVDAQGNVRLVDVGRLPRDEAGQPVLPPGLRKPTTSAPKDLTLQQQRAFDVLKGTEAFKNAVERNNEAEIRKLLIGSGIPPEAYLGAQAAPPGGGTWAGGPAAAAPAAAAPAAAGPAAAPRTGLNTRQPAQPASQKWLAGRVQDLQRADAELAAAQAQASAAAKSGDTNAIVQYGNILNRARANRDAIFKEVAPYQ